MNANQLKLALKNFNGSEQFFRHLGILYTEGVQYLAEKANSYWLLDLVASHARHDKWREVEEFVTVKLKVENQTGKVIFDNGNGEILGGQEIEYTDFPLDEISLWLCWNGQGYTLLLPSEY